MNNIDQCGAQPFPNALLDIFGEGLLEAIREKLKTLHTNLRDCLTEIRVIEELIALIKYCAAPKEEEPVLIKKILALKDPMGHWPPKEELSTLREDP